MAENGDFDLKCQDKMTYSGAEFDPAAELDHLRNLAFSYMNGNMINHDQVVPDVLGKPMWKNQKLESSQMKQDSDILSAEVQSLNQCQLNAVGREARKSKSGWEKLPSVTPEMDKDGNVSGLLFKAGSLNLFPTIDSTLRRRQ